MSIGFDYEPPQVRREERLDDHGCTSITPVPSLMLHKLRWLAALIESELGIRCRVAQLNGPDVYDYQFGGTAGNLGSYGMAWKALGSMEVGAREALKVVGAAQEEQ